MMSDDEFLKKIGYACEQAYKSINWTPTQSDDNWLLPYKSSLLEAEDAYKFRYIWSTALINVFGIRKVIDDMTFWNTLYVHMFNHALTLPKLDLIENKTYRLKSSHREFKVCDGGEDVVVIQFLDDTHKIDLPRKDFNNECELV
jgi:hypothetical protein